MTSSEESRNSEGVLYRLRATIREEEGVDVAWADLGELLAESRARFGCHEGIRIGELRRLIGDRLQHALIAVTNIGAHQLTVEVEELIALWCPEPRALGVFDGNRIRRGLW